MKTFYRINSHTWKGSNSHTFRSGHNYLILVLTHGSCRISLDGKEQQCLPTDMLLLKPGQEQTLCTSARSSACSMLSISIPTKALVYFSDETCNLYQKFQFAPHDTAVIHAEIEAAMSIRNIATKLATTTEEKDLLGAEIYAKSLFASFLVLFLRACVQNDQVHQLHQKKELIIDDVFQYISHHLTEDLSLKTLEKEFFVSGEHISRQFKKSAGVTLHSYIIRSRIDLSKKYILQGIPIRDVYQKCGFGSYNHFFKAFKKECQMTPIEYYRNPAPSQPE